MTDYSSSHKRLFRLAFVYRTPWALMALLSFLSAASIIVLMHGLSIAIDAVFMQQSPLALVQPALLLIAGAIAVRGILFWIHEILAQKTASQIKASLREQLFGKIQQLGPAWTETQNSGDLAATAVEGVEKLDAYYARFIPAAIHMSVVPVVIVIAIFLIDWLSGLILLITGPLIPVFMSLIGMRARQQVQRQWATLRYLSSHFLDAVQGLRTLKLFTREHRKHTEIEHISDRFRVSTMGVLKIAFLSGFVLELFASLATALVAVEIGVRLIEGHIVFQVGLFVLLLAPEYYLPFRMFGAQHHAGMEGTESAGRVFAILDKNALSQKVIVNGDLDEQISSDYQQFLLNKYSGPVKSRNCFKDITAAAAAEEHEGSPSVSVVFKNVTFTYPGKSYPVLANCSFKLPKRSKTALVGVTGSGKTTILRLLTRQLAPDSGWITLGGMPSTKTDDGRWLENMAVVNQTNWFFDDTLLANLLAARPNATYEEVVSASKVSGAHEFIQKLPDGYLTGTGEFAARFSGGERQRISIARALLKDAPILILDEPSSALDPESEEIINRALDELMANKTVFLIAHRLSTVRKADNILVLESGRITAQGTHTYLRANCKLYEQMVSAYAS